MAHAAQEATAGGLAAHEPVEGDGRGSPRLGNALVFVLSLAFAFAFWELVSRTGLIREQDLPSMTATMDELWSLVQTREFWSAFLQTARGWAIGLGLATAARRPDRDRPRPERPRGPRVPRADRVPPPDPVRGADPAALPHARADAQERGLPRDVRRVLADSRADDVRRARRRPRDHRHGALVRRAQARAAVADHAAERCPVHRDRDAASRRRSR